MKNSEKFFFLNTSLFIFLQYIEKEKIPYTGKKF